jgi:hypothetical protein
MSATAIVLTTILTLAMGALGIYATKWYGRKGSLPTYCVWSTVLLDGDGLPRTVETTFGGNPVRQLSVSRIAFWNAGSDPIRDMDLQQLDPLRIEHNEHAEILAHMIAAQSLPANAFSTHNDAKATVKCSLSYLDPNQYAVVDVVHTGATEGLLMRGTLSGVIKDRHLRRVYPGTRAAQRMVGGGVLGGAAAVVVATCTHFQSLTARVVAPLLVVALGAVTSKLLVQALPGLPRALRPYARPPLVSELEEKGNE